MENFEGWKTLKICESGKVEVFDKKSISIKNFIVLLKKFNGVANIYDVKIFLKNKAKKKGLAYLSNKRWRKCEVYKVMKKVGLEVDGTYEHFKKSGEPNENLFEMKKLDEIVEIPKTEKWQNLFYDFMSIKKYGKAKQSEKKKTGSKRRRSTKIDDARTEVCGGELPEVRKPPLKKRKLLNNTNSPESDINEMERSIGKMLECGKLPPDRVKSMVTKIIFKCLDYNYDETKKVFASE